MARTVRRRTSNWDLLTASEKATRTLEQEEIYLPPKPEHDVPELPDDLTELDDSALMILFRELTEWTVYMGAKLAAAEVDEKYAAASLDKMKALTAAANPGEKAQWKAKAKAYEDKDYVAAEERHHVAYAYRKMLNSVYDATNAKSTLISRELTRRVGRNDRENRSGKWAA